MNIKKIKIIKNFDSIARLQAVASVEFCNGLVINDIKIIKKSEDSNQLYIAMPSKQCFFYADDKQGIFS